MLLPSAITQKACLAPDWRRRTGCRATRTVGGRFLPELQASYLQPVMKTEK